MLVRPIGCHSGCSAFKSCVFQETLLLVLLLCWLSKCLYAWVKLQSDVQPPLKDKKPSMPPRQRKYNMI